MATLNDGSDEKVKAAAEGEPVVVGPKLAVMFVSTQKASEMGFACKSDGYTYLLSTGLMAKLANNGMSVFSSLDVAKQHFLNFALLI